MKLPKCQEEEHYQHQFPETNLVHGADPIIWSDNANCLYIGSTWANKFEKIDLRQNKCNEYVDNNNSICNLTIESLFDLKIDKETLSARLCL